MAEQYPSANWAEQPPASLPPQVRTNGLAIASLVLGILWLYWIGSILALVFGYIALHQIRRSNGWQEGRGIAVAGVVLGWVGVGVLAVLLVLVAAIADDAESGRPFTRSGVTPIDDGTAISTATTFSTSSLEEEVLGRGAPDPTPPPADTASDALQITLLVEGAGERAEVGDTIVVHYVGKLPNGTVFDSSWENGQPFPVELGQRAVIAGWEEGLVGAQRGERRRLVLGPDMAYGAQGTGGIPPNTPLAFEIDVIDVVETA